MGNAEVDKLAAAAALMLDRFEWLDGELCVRVFVNEMVGYEMRPVDEDMEETYLLLQEASRGDEIHYEEKK